MGSVYLICIVNVQGAIKPPSLEKKTVWKQEVEQHME